MQTIRYFLGLQFFLFIFGFILKVDRHISTYQSDENFWI
ncbi:hypothetical protein ZPR_3705 [Zunongwangia profunda SM-A87]|uniref:Uncharacterized protein n=1 Tax=Zunongwangia profunda (strain DSM 18752 / CCTCC AB 206139 / SM-A87) TaxID=655815 RepID=D5BL89_ZUNPS|nr:hypothetical protein ZPR_3705 [Zunongwangia profunda SM-A87]